MLLLFMFILYHFKVDVIYMVSARENTMLFSFVIKSFNLPLINMDLFFFFFQQTSLSLLMTYTFPYESQYAGNQRIA